LTPERTSQRTLRSSAIPDRLKFIGREGQAVREHAHRERPRGERAWLFRWQGINDALLVEDAPGPTELDEVILEQLTESLARGPRLVAEEFLFERADHVLGRGRVVVPRPHGGSSAVLRPGAGLVAS